MCGPLVFVGIYNFILSCQQFISHNCTPLTVVTMYVSPDSKLMHHTFGRQYSQFYWFCLLFAYCSGCSLSSNIFNETSEILSTFIYSAENLDHCVAESTRRGRRGICGWGSELSFFTDGPKLGGRVFCKEHSVSLSFRLPYCCSVFRQKWLISRWPQTNFYEVLPLSER